MEAMTFFHQGKSQGILLIQILLCRRIGDMFQWKPYIIVSAWIWDADSKVYDVWHLKFMKLGIGDINIELLVSKIKLNTFE